MIYLDNGATSFPKPEAVVEAVGRALRAPASPGRSGHRPALEASRIVYRARKNIARLFGLPDLERVAFTPNITWALNIAIWGLGLTKGDHILSGPLEHNSVARPLALAVRELGAEWEAVPLGGDGFPDPLEFGRRTRPGTRAVVLGHASNVTGALFPVREIKKAVGEVPLILDTAQTAGAVPLDDAGSFADILTFTGHKGLLGPTGTGGLWIREGMPMRPLAVGGTGSKSESLAHPDFLPDALEAGTLNTHGLAGLAAGVGFILETGVERIRAHEMALARAFLEGIDGIGGLRILGPPPGDWRRVATVSVTMENWSSSDLAQRLEADYGIMIRAGLHCSPMAHGALGSFPGGAARFSFGYFNTMEEALTAARALSELSGAKGRA